MEVKATPRLRDLDVKKRGCRFPDESRGVMEIFQDYSQDGCQFECLLKSARHQCRCTMWNMPIPENEENDWPVCDVYGNTCFDTIMNRPKTKGCNCLEDCNVVKFSVAAKESALDPVKECDLYSTVAFQEAFHKTRLLGSNLFYSYYKLPYFIGMDEAEKNQSYSYHRTLNVQNRDICQRMVSKDLAMVSVNFGSNTYMRTSMDKRVTFSDQISSIGKEYFSANRRHFDIFWSVF